MSTRILGIDPGLTRCGAGVIELSGSRRVTLVEVNTFRSSPDAELSVRIGGISREIEALIIRAKPQIIAMERVYADANVRSVMGTAQISGVVLMLADKYSLPIALHTPTEVKAAVTGSGRADKAQVGAMVARILGLSEVPKPADAADSLAIAICHGWRSAGAATAPGETMTKAQQSWHAAERAAAQRRER